MADLQISVSPDRVEVRRDHGKNPDGTDAVETFSATAQQAAKLLPTLQASELQASHRLSKGDADAIRDIANEAAKRKARGE